jgi:ferritin-like metal-binding protein YciE
METKSSSKKTGARHSKAASGAAEDSKLREFFVDELKDILWAEKHIIQALPKLKKAAGSDELRQAFEEHLEATKHHVARLEKVFGILDEKASAKKCEAMEGIVKEGQSIIEDTDEGTATRDVGLVLAAQKVEHYEIATYGGLIQLAKVLGHEDAADLLYETIKEEEEADQLLTRIAESHINYDAAQEMEH